MKNFIFLITILLFVSIEAGGQKPEINGFVSDRGTTIWDEEGDIKERKELGNEGDSSVYQINSQNPYVMVSLN